MRNVWPYYVIRCFNKFTTGKTYYLFYLARTVEYLNKKYLEITYLYYMKLSEVIGECTLAYYNGFNVINNAH